MKKLSVFFISIMLISCSSLPKRAMESFVVKNRASAFIDSGSAYLTQRNYALAKQNFDKAYNLALSVDSTEQLCYISLVRISLSLSQKEGAEGIIQAKTELESAKKYAAKSDISNILLSLCDLYEAEIALSENAKENATKAEMLILQNQKQIAKEPYYFALSYKILGNAYIAQQKYAEAEKSLLEAAKLYEQNRYVSQLGLTWYTIAQTRSLWGKKQEAIAAINTAIKFDRALENSFALAEDYYALGLILSKNTTYETVTPEQKQQAANAFAQSAAIYKAGGFADFAKQAEQKSAEIQ